MCWAIRPARHQASSPLTTRRQIRGSRWRTSRTWPTRRLPASTVMPIAAASSMIANSDTHGAPAPASGRPVSRPRSTTVAASSSGTSWAAQNSRIRLSIRTSAASRACLFGAHGIEEGDLRVALELEYRCCCHDPIEPVTADTQERVELGLWTGSSEAGHLWTFPAWLSGILGTEPTLVARRGCDRSDRNRWLRSAFGCATWSRFADRLPVRPGRPLWLRPTMTSRRPAHRRGVSRLVADAPRTSTSGSVMQRRLCGPAAGGGPGRRGGPWGPWWPCRRAA